MLAIVLAGCAGSAGDPFESVNRKMFAVHLTLDRYALKPTARGYALLPEPPRRAVRNVLANLGAPAIFANDVLQAEWRRAGITARRFAVNTTLGLGGLMDVARRFDLPRHGEDFGQTLATYGIGTGPYLFIPVLGPTTPRAFIGLNVDAFASPLNLLYPPDAARARIIGGTLGGLDARTEALDLLDEIEATSVDFYATLRNLYRQRRDSEIANGATDIDDLPDLPDLDEYE